MCVRVYILYIHDCRILKIQDETIDRQTNNSITLRAIGPPAKEDVKRAACDGDKTNTRRNQLKGPDSHSYYVPRIQGAGMCPGTRPRS